MESLDLGKVACRLCITPGPQEGPNRRLSNLFTKTIRESATSMSETIDDCSDYVLNMRLNEALESYTCIEFQNYDGLPDSICGKCEKHLVETVFFIHRSKDTQQILNSCASRLQRVAKKEVVDIDDDNSTYLIEVLNEEGDAINPDDYDSQESVPIDQINIDEQCIDPSEDGEDTEDAVSFLRNVKREDGDDAVSLKVVKKNHSCNYCKKTFLRKSNLIDHLRLHANVRPFSCTYCDKSFVQSGNLKSHLRTHTKERPFHCLLCPKSYSQSSALKVHYRTHTNERNYGCEVCAKHFTNASDLTKHKRIHDPGSKITCEFCDRKFAQRVNYRNHLRSNHSTEINDHLKKSPKKLLTSEGN